MPPPRNGNEYVPFEKLIQLERINKDTFRSIALPFAPDGPNGAPGAAYGGHVFMQAAWAACLTVAKGFLLSVRRSKDNNSQDADSKARTSLGTSSCLASQM